MKNEIQKKEENKVVEFQGNKLLAMQAQSEVVLNKDTLELSRLVIVNPLSSFKKEHEELKDGEIVRSDDFSVVIGKKQKKSFIPLGIKQYFDTYEITSAGKNLISREKYTGQPKDYEDSKVIKTVVFETYFLDRDITMSLPLVFTFRHGSNSTGKKLLTLMYTTNKLFNRAPWACAINLFASTRKNKDGKEFDIIDFAVDKTPLTQEELANCEKWVSGLLNAEVQVSEDSVE